MINTKLADLRGATGRSTQTAESDVNWSLSKLGEDRLSKICKQECSVAALECCK
jgi:hypothetical protein